MDPGDRRVDATPDPDSRLLLLIVIDHNNGVPVYRQIVEQIRFHIASGLIEPGDELPSTRALAEELRLNHMTVSKAFVILEKEKLIERRPGKSTVVSELSPDSVEDERIEQLRTVLEPVVTATRQLGFQPVTAARIYRQMLEDARRELEV